MYYMYDFSVCGFVLYKSLFNILGIVEVIVGGGFGDFSFRFDQVFYYVMIRENFFRGIFVIIVRVILVGLGSGFIIYFLVNSNDQQVFLLGVFTGIIIINNGVTLDFEVVQEVYVMVVVISGGFFIYIRLVVQLIDVNDNVFKFVQNVYYFFIWEGEEGDQVYVIQVR